MDLAVGIDIGTYTCQIGIVDHPGKIRIGKAIQTEQKMGAENFIGRLSEGIVSLADPLSDQIGGIGLGIPSWDGDQQMIVNPPNHPQFQGLAVCRRLGVALPRWRDNILADNDANVALDAERFFGNHKNAEYGIMIFTLGGGVGFCAYMYHPPTKRLYKTWGWKMRAGEGGHIIVPVPPQLKDYKYGCGCGCETCLEAFASAGAAERFGQQSVIKHKMGGPETLIVTKIKEDDNYDPGESLEEQLTALHIEQAAAEGDEVAYQIMFGVATALAHGIRVHTQVFDCPVVVIAGGMSRWAALIDLTRQIYAGLPGVIPNEAHIVVSELQHTGVLGAAAQILFRDQIWA